jgi:hypothetical protein
MTARKGDRPARPYYKFPWTPAMLDSLARMNREKPGLTLRRMGELLASAYGGQVPDPATVRRALARMAVR